MTQRNVAVKEKGHLEFWGTKNYSTWVFIFEGFWTFPQNSSEDLPKSGPQAALFELDCFSKKISIQDFRGSSVNCSMFLALKILMNTDEERRQQMKNTDEECTM